MRSIEDIEFEELFEGRPRFPTPALNFRHKGCHFLGHMMFEGQKQDIYLVEYLWADHDSRLVIVLVAKEQEEPNAWFYVKCHNKFAPIADKIRRKTQQLGWEKWMAYGLDE